MFFFPARVTQCVFVVDRHEREHRLPMKLKKSLLFFLSFPQETQQIPTEEVALDICLSNGQKVTVNILTSDQTEDVLDVSAGLHKQPVDQPALLVVHNF